MTRNSAVFAALLGITLLSCTGSGTATKGAETSKEPARTATPEYFLLRPEVEKAYGYTHAVKIGDDIKISGAVSMDDEGNPTAVGDLEQQSREREREFLEKYLLPWIPRFCLAGRLATQEPFWKAVLDLLEGFVESEAVRVNRQS